MSIIQLYAGQFAYLCDKNTGNVHLQQPESVFDVSYARAYLFYPDVFAPKYEMEMLLDNVFGNLYYNLRTTIDDRRLPSRMTALEFSNLTRSLLGPDAIKKLIAQVVQPFEETLESMHSQLLKTIRDYYNLEQNIFLNQKLEQITASEDRVNRQQDFMPISRTISQAINQTIGNLCGIPDLINVSLVIKLDDIALERIERIETDMMDAQTKIREGNINMTQGSAVTTILENLANPTRSKATQEEIWNFANQVTGTNRMNTDKANPEQKLHGDVQKNIESKVKGASITIIDTFLMTESSTGISHEAKIEAIHEALPDFFFEYRININHFYTELLQHLQEVAESKSVRVRYAIAEEVLLKHMPGHD